MSALGTSTLALAVVYAAVGGHALLLWAGRREDRVVWAFGMLCLSVGAYSLASTALSVARTVGDACLAQSVQLVTGSFATAFHLSYCQELRGTRNPPVIAFGYALPVLACGLALAGLLVGPGAVDLAASSMLGFAPHRVHAVLAPGGELVELWIFASVCLAVYLAYSGDDPQRLRPAVWAPAAVVLSVAFDITAEHAQLNTASLTEYSFLGLTIAFSQRLIARGRRVADALEQRTAELQASARRIETTQQELVRREQLAAAGEMSSIVAHELRNPLAIIRNAITSLERGRVDDDNWRTLVDMVDEEADRLDHLVGDLLTYSKPIQLGATPVDASELLAMASERARLSEPPGPPVQLELRAGRVRCVADRELLCQALCNLIDNARNAMPDGGTITVEASDASLDGQPATRFRVIDTGTGIPPPLLDHVRELFFTTRPTGTGLGLAIVERVVSAHGGRIDIESELGRGTTVSFCIPWRKGVAS